MKLSTLQVEKKKIKELIKLILLVNKKNLKNYKVKVINNTPGDSFKFDASSKYVKKNLTIINLLVLK